MAGNSAAESAIGAVVVAADRVHDMTDSPLDDEALAGAIRVLTA